MASISSGVMSFIASSCSRAFLARSFLACILSTVLAYASGKVSYQTSLMVPAYFEVFSCMLGYLVATLSLIALNLAESFCFIDNLGSAGISSSTTFSSSLAASGVSVALSVVLSSALVSSVADAVSLVSSTFLSSFFSSSGFFAAAVLSLSRFLMSATLALAPSLRSRSFYLRCSSLLDRPPRLDLALLT